MTSRKRNLQFVFALACWAWGACAAGSPAPPTGAPDADAGPRPFEDAASRGDLDAGGLDSAPLDGADAPDASLADADASEPESARWEGTSVYLLMVDRFANGGPDPERAKDPCFDPSHPRRFHGGDLIGLREHLDYLDELGVETVWVTPLARQIGIVRDSAGDECGFHGYWAALEAPDDGAIEPRLGGDEELRALLRSMHGRGMRLMLDVVVNHAGFGAPITRQRPGWFQPSDGCMERGNPDETCPLAGLPDFDQSRPEVASYLSEQTAGWLRRFEIDAIRIDTVKHVPLSFFAEWWVPAVRRARPNAYLLGELWNERPYATQHAYLDAGFDGLFDFRLHAALTRELGQNGNLDAVAARVREAWDELGPERARLRGAFLENHDLPRFASEIRAPDEATAIARMHLGLAVITTTPGVPQLFAGTELGMAGRWPDNRRDMPSWAFDARARPGRRDGYLGDPADNFGLTRALLAARRAHPALRVGDYVELWRPGGSGVPLFAFARGAGESRVIVTLSTGAVSARIPLRGNPHLDAASRATYGDGVELVDRLGRTRGAQAVVRDGMLELTLPAGAIAIWAPPGT